MCVCVCVCVCVSSGVVGRSGPDSAGADHGVLANAVCDAKVQYPPVAATRVRSLQKVSLLSNRWLKRLLAAQT